MSGLKTEIIDGKMVKGTDSLCLDQYKDGSVRLICDEHLEGIDGHGICNYKSRAMINLSKFEMMKLISTYLANDLEYQEGN